jgi:uncharacterized protein YpmB
MKTLGLFLQEKQEKLTNLYLFFFSVVFLSFFYFFWSTSNECKEGDRCKQSY